MRTRCVIALLLGSASAWAANPAVEFSGVLTEGAKTSVALTDKTNGQTAWVDVGSEHNGYIVRSYDPKTETITLKHGLEEFSLQLIAAKSPESGNTTTAANDAAAPATGEASINAVRNNLRQLALAARQHQIDTGSPTATYADLVGPDKPIKQLIPVDGENYTTLTFGPNATNLSVTTASGITVAVDTPTSGATLGASATNSVAQPAAPAQPAAAPTPTGPINTSHVVREGDTFEKIAEATGVPPQQLQALNPDVNPSSLQVGQPIRIR